MTSVRIDLDNSGSAFACLDYVTGRVVMNISSEVTVTSITVKMEGISRTRLPIPKDADGNRDSRKRAEVEIHRLLYLVETVFPSQEIREKTSTSNSGFTLKAGQYEYPFKIRIPINSNCGNDPSVGGLMNRLSFDKGSLDYAKDASTHLRGTLPPSLSGIPDDEASIRYFLKATVNRPQFYKSNMRSYNFFVFLPIEPPRPPLSPSETFAKRQHQMTHHQPSPSPSLSPSKKRGLFPFSFRNQPPPTPTFSVTPETVHFSIETRLPAPPIVVPNNPLPLRILLVKLSPYHTSVVIRTIQIHLFAFTEIRAHGLQKTERMVFPLLNLSGLSVPIGGDGSPHGEELEADPNLWRSTCLPDTVPPSFKTCNISRSYQLEIVLGLSHGVQGMVEVIPLLMPLEVYSGIAPPQKLIDAALYSDTPPKLPRRTRSDQYQTLKVPTAFAGSHSTQSSPVSSPVSPSFPKRPHSSSDGQPWPTDAASASALVSTSPSPSPSPSPSAPALMSKSRPSISGGGTQGEMPPPTYEDALADDIGPVDGPRRRYVQEGAYYDALPSDVHA